MQLSNANRRNVFIIYDIDEIMVQAPSHNTKRIKIQLLKSVLANLPLIG